ncbi:ccr4 associated factor [Blastocladiella emersonii ATCC 22665]|nr:ccr4 associated factor [Blastocladiella emersonii ATCC 22665]
MYLSHLRTTTRNLSTSALPFAACAHLASRRVLAVRGAAATDFLQGLVTQHMPRVASSAPLAPHYAAFLTPQGRVLYDAFVYRSGEEDGFLLDVHADHAVPLHAHLRRYRLRTKVEVADVSAGYGVWAAWGVADVGSADPRWTGLGARALVPAGEAVPEWNAEKVSEQEYTLRRLVLGVPEGTDFAPGTALPLESNFEYLNAIDFRKGCYVGQELTIRTHHTGVVRKRIVPVVVERADSSPSSSPKSPAEALDRTADMALPSQGADIGGEGGRAVGKWAAGACNVGLALMRLEAVDGVRRFEVKGAPGVVVRPVIPEWWPKQ